MKKLVQSLINMLQEFLTKLEEKELVSYAESRNSRVLQMAASQIGVVEWSPGSNPQVEKYLDHGASASDTDSGLRDETPWCAGFVAFCLEKVGMGSTNSLMARSYERWGVSVKSAPLPGDIVTFYRNGISSGQGHVGFFVDETPTHVYVLGGNQSNEVNVTLYSKSRMTDIRRTSKERNLNPDQVALLDSLKTRIKKGQEINPPGSVV